MPRLLARLCGGRYAANVRSITSSLHDGCCEPGEGLRLMYATRGYPFDHGQRRRFADERRRRRLGRKGAMARLRGWLRRG